MAPPSHCDGCDRTLSWFELVPVFSWLALRGRCRTCGVKIPAVYTIIEFFTGLFFALEWTRWGWSCEFVIGLVFISALGTLSAALFAHRQIPGKILAPPIILLFLCRIWSHPLGLWSYLAGAVVGLLVVMCTKRMIHPNGLRVMNDTKDSLFLCVSLGLFLGLFLGVFGMCLMLITGKPVSGTARLVLRVDRKIPIDSTQRVLVWAATSLIGVTLHLYGGVLYGYCTKILGV